MWAENMTNKFEKFADALCRDDASADYWYDEGIIEAQDMLEKFLPEDWDRLRQIIKNKPDEWKKRVIYCFDGENTEKQIEIVFDLMDTEDKELFEGCIDTLRCLINEDNRDKIKNMPQIECVHKYLPKENGIMKMIYLDFFKKIL